MFTNDLNIEEAEDFRVRLISKISALSDEQLIMLAELARDFCSDSDR